MTSDSIPEPDTKAFFERHGAALERYYPALLRSVEAGIVAATCRSDNSVQELLGLYSYRAEHLTRFTSDDATRLRSETLRLCSALAATTEAFARVWVLHMTPSESVIVFEGVRTGSLLGVLNVFNNRQVTPAQRRALWGEVSDPICPNCGSVVSESTIAAHAKTCTPF